MGGTICLSLTCDEDEKRVDETQGQKDEEAAPQLHHVHRHQLSLNKQTHYLMRYSSKTSYNQQTVRKLIIAHRN